MAAMHAPNVESEASREGTAAHWVMAEVLLNYRDKRSGPLMCSGYIDQTAPNGVVIDEKMAEGAQVIVDDVLEVAQKYGALQSMLIEYRVQAPHIHDQHNWGTLDVAIYLPEQFLLFVWDYKHGHREVRAKENLQLINYAEGLRHEFGIDGAHDQRLTVNFRVVQPFCYSAAGVVSEWQCLMSDLRPYTNQLYAKAYDAFSNPTLSSGKHCRDCPAVGMCAGAKQAAYNLIDVVNEPYQMDTMDGPALATERRILTDGLAAAKARLEALEENLQHRIQNGEVGTGLALEAATGREKWTVPPEQAAALATQFGFTISQLAVKTPNQARQAAPKEVRTNFATVIKTMTERPPGGLKLVDAADSRTAQAFKRK